MVAALVAAAGFALLYATLGFHYETNDDGIMELIFRGILLPASTTREIGFAHRFTASVFGWLYERAPRFPWYGASMYSLTLVATTSLLAGVDQAIALERRSLLRLAALSFFFFTFLAESVLLLNLTRVAILLAGASVLAVWRGAHRGARFPVPMLGILFAFFGLAAATRLQGAELGLIVAGGFAVLVPRPNGLPRLAAAILVFTTITVLFEVDARAGGRESYFRSVYPFLVSIRDLDWVEASPRTPGDSLRLEAVTAWLFSDHEVVTVPVLSRLSSDAYVTAGKVRWPRLLASARSVASSVGWSGWLLVFVNTLAFARAFRRGDPKMKPRLLRYLAAHGLLWTIALLLAVFARILPRVISPMIALYACASVVTVVELGVPSLPDRMRRSRRILAVFAGVLCAALFAAAVQRMSVCRRGEQSNVDLLRTLRDRLRGSVVVLTRPALPAFAYIDPLEGIDLDHGSRFVIVGGWPCLLRGYDEDARSLAGSSRFPDLWLALARWRALVVSNDHYNRFLRRYLSTLYGVELDFSPRSAWMAVGPGPKHQVRVYGLATSPPGGSRLDSWGRPARGATAGELLGEE